MRPGSSYSRHDRRRPAEEQEAESSAHARKRQARQELQGIDQPSVDEAARRDTAQDDRDDGDQEDEGDDDDEIDVSLLPAEGIPETEKAKRAAEGLGKEAIMHKTYELVRYALACEYTKTPIRKDNISKRVLNGRQGASAFPVIFNKAQKMLRNTFGYTLVELRPLGVDNQQFRTQNETATDTQDAESSTASRCHTVDKSKQSQREDATKANPATKSWMLRSALPSRLIRKLALGDNQLSDALNEGDEMTAVGADEEGTVLDWKKADRQLGSFGLLYVILSLILLNGRVIGQGQLLAYLRRLRLYPEAKLPSRVQPDSVGSHGSDSATQGATQRAHHAARGRRADASDASLDDFLFLLRKQHYLERIRTDVAAAGGTTQATQRHALGSRMRDDEEGASYEWRWGSRAEAEVDEKSIAAMIETIFHEQEAAAAEDEQASGEHPGDAEVSARRLAQRRKALLRDIETAAGSQLVSL
ncbi:hypothetical protein ACQY0O_000904 [Thecaphora frezii]